MYMTIFESTSVEGDGMSDTMPIQEEELSRLMAQFVNKLRDQGGKGGNIGLRRALNLSEDVYFTVRDRLADEGKISRYRAKGGGVALVEEHDSCPAQVLATPENELYEDIANTLRDGWAKQYRLGDQSIVAVTALQGRRQTGGTWTRPDLVTVSVREYAFLPGKHLIVQTFEVKASGMADVTAVYEALAHRRAAHQAYVWLQSQQPIDENVLKRVEEEARRHGVGLILASNPAEFGTWEVVAEAEFVEPSPEDLNEFLSIQLTDNTKEQVRRLVR